MVDKIKRIRLQLALGKFPITEVKGSRVKLALGGTTTIEFNVTDRADVRVGDLLTLYTEVYTKDFPHATAFSTRQ